MFQEMSFTARTARRWSSARSSGTKPTTAARVLDVAVRPLVLRAHEEHVEAQAVRRVEAALDHLGDVALAAPDREMPRARRPVLRGHPARCAGRSSKARGVREVAGRAPRPTPCCSRRARAAGTGDSWVSIGHSATSLVAARDQRRVGLLPLPVAHGGAAARVDHPPHARAAGRLEDVVGADHVVAQDASTGGFGLHVRGQMHHRVHAAERRARSPPGRRCRPGGTPRPRPARRFSARRA